jgi:polar amino acid transport system permease protein
VSWNWRFAWEILPSLLGALVVTVEAALGGFALAAIVGLVLALLRRTRWPFLPTLIGGYIEFVRSTPLLVQLYFLFFVLPRVGLILSPLTTGVLGLGLHIGTYTAEVYRAGIESVPRTQWEAATALSLPRHRVWLGVVLPQAIPKIIPALGNYLVSSFKDTPVLSAITIIELLGRAEVIGSVTFRYLEPMTLVGIIYLGVSYAAAVCVRMVGQRFAPQV